MKWRDLIGVIAVTLIWSVLFPPKAILAFGILLGFIVVLIYAYDGWKGERDA